MSKTQFPTDIPAQTQSRQPGIESEMDPAPIADLGHQGVGKLKGKVALITGGDSGIGRATAIAFAREGADVAITYLDEHGDAKETVAQVEALGRTCKSFAGDIGSEEFCKDLIEKAMAEFGHLDILVNKAAEQHPKKELADISAEQLEATFRTNVYSMFYLTKAALPHLKEGASIINTTSVTAYRGSPALLDY